MEPVGVLGPADDEERRDGRPLADRAVDEVLRDPTGFRLEYLPQGSSRWAYYATASVPLTGAFLNEDSGTVTTSRGGTSVVFRGQVRGTLIGSAGAETLVPVVALPMEDTALRRAERVTGVLAGGRALRPGGRGPLLRRVPPALRPGVLVLYDVYDDTRSQVFPGTKVGSSTREYASSDAAVAATAGQALSYGGKIAFTQFSSSNGGYSAVGSQPYLRPVRDDWDAVADNPNHTWETTVPISRIEGAYPSVGRLTRLRITSRTGLGDEGGRVLGIVVEGASGSVSTTGSSSPRGWVSSTTGSRPRSPFMRPSRET